MCRRFIFVLIALVFGLTASAQATTVIWVSDNKAPTGGIPADQGWVDLLVAQGYDVDLRFRAQQARGLDTAEIAILNAADLIIVSRDTDSGQYASDAAEIAVWNGITAPILLQIGHFARSNRWIWLNTTATNDALANPLEAVDLTHPVFNGVTLDASNRVSILTMGTSFASTTAQGNGKLIARRADNSQVWIVEWQTGQEFYTGGGQYAAGPRMLFCSGSDEGTDGRYNLNADGEKIFLNAVKYLSGFVQVNASEPIPADGAAVPPTGKVTGGVFMLLTFTAGETATSHKAYFSADFNDVNDRDPAVNLGSPPYPDVYPTGYYVGFDVPELPAFARVPLTTGKTYYWAVDESDGVSTFPGKVWSFRIVPEQAWDPTPVDGDLYVNADPNVALSWKLGSIITTGYNVSYDVYYGTVFADVNTSTTPTVHVILTSAVTGSLPANTVYYWRVDTKLNYSNPPFALYTTIKGDVWSFKTLPVVAITDPDLVGWWKLDGDIVPAIAFDSSGYANHGTLRGDPEYVAGQVDNAMDFDGGDDYVYTGKTASQLGIAGNAPRTVSVWVFTRAFNNGGIWDVGNRAGSDGQDFCLRTFTDATYPTNRWRVQYWGGDYDFTYPSLNEWVHFGHVHDGANTRIYANGELVVDWTKTLNTQDTNPFQIGAYGWQVNYFNGIIDDLRLYTKVLSAKEIKVLAGLLLASSPNPANIATGVARTPTLSWEPGAYAASVSGHKVYFSADRDPVMNRTVTGITRTDPCYPVATILDLGKTYYWAVDEVNNLHLDKVWPGDLWSFTTINNKVVDNFETYEDEQTVPVPLDVNWIYFVYTDGFGDLACTPGSGNGSGAKIALQRPGQGGSSLAMTFQYDNDGMVKTPSACNPLEPEVQRAYYSKAEAQVAKLPSGIGSDWTAGGVTKALSLWFYGDPLNSIEPMWVQLTDASNNKAKVLYGAYADEDTTYMNDPNWHEWLIDLEDFNVPPTRVNVKNIKSIAIGIGNEAGPAGSSGTLYFDDIRLYTPRCVLTRRSADFAAFDYAPAGNPAGDCVLDYRELELMTQDWLLNDYNVTGDANLINFPTDNSQWVAGKKNNALNFDGINDHVYAQRIYLPRSAFSVAMWINPRIDLGPTTRRMDLIYWGVGNRPHLTFNRSGGAAGAIGLWPNTGAADFDGPQTVTTSWTANTWCHIAATFNGTDFKIYANGALEGTVNHPGTHSAASGPRIGNHNTAANNFDGRIDDFRIYAYALSDSDVARLANQTGEPAAGPLFWFKFDETSGNTADESVGTLIYVPLPRPEIDVYGDGTIDFKDYAVLVTRWLDEDLYP